MGDSRAPDTIVVAWARDHEQVLFTHDLDFGAILAASRGARPSVIQLRAKDPTPEAIGTLLLEALAACGPQLQQGALVSLDEDTQRLRLLPLR